MVNLIVIRQFSSLEILIDTYQFRVPSLKNSRLTSSLTINAINTC